MFPGFFNCFEKNDRKILGKITQEDWAYLAPTWRQLNSTGAEMEKSIRNVTVNTWIKRSDEEFYALWRQRQYNGRCICRGQQFNGLKKSRRVCLFLGPSFRMKADCFQENMAMTLVFFHCLSAQSFVLPAFPLCSCQQAHIKRRYYVSQGLSHLDRIVQCFGKCDLYTQGYYVRKLPLNNIREYSFKSSRLKVGCHELWWVYFNQFEGKNHSLSSRKWNDARNIRNHSSYRLSLSIEDLILLKSDEEKGEEKLGET
jgi:hypothetical protein